MTAVLDDEFPMQWEREAGMPDNCPKVLVSFGIAPHEDQEESAKQGTPWYKDVEYIKIFIPGDAKTVVFQPADAKYRRRFPESYRAFRERQEGTAKAKGKPLTLWPPISRGLAWSLMAAGIQTVEMLASMEDDVAEKFPQQVRDLRAKARLYLEEAHTGAALTAAASREKELADTIASLQAQITALQQADIARQQAEAEAATAAPGKQKGSKAA